ncbi:NADH-quinone oxidoreductase subunit B family protein, partial [[Eubacterium] cellulosolvens]
ERIHAIRKRSRTLVTIGACATAGGIQGLRNFKDVREFVSTVYANPEYISTLEVSTPIAHHVRVDFELRGCPISRPQLLEVLGAFLRGRRPNIPSYSVCFECKRQGTVCVMVAHGTPCLGPVTQAGCGALCPSYHRGCYGCFGPMESPNTVSLGARWEAMGAARPDLVRAFRTYNAGAVPFRAASEAYEQQEP